MQFNEEGLRNMKDFLQTYNKLSESCFNSCVINLNNRNLTSEESTCTDICVQKLFNGNNRTIGVYMKEQPAFTQRKMEEAEAKAQQVLDSLKAQGYNPEEMSQEELAAAAMKVTSEQAAGP
eukprot:TRINITY_DN79667_c0_g1_i1.p1 TRINITY_DN79667_c0_g1~~TRINITY_DN79667_c0_g1_i1.p1  ORF type:complete len:130 (-),score=31.09 TRINITY_DN79667_c0_g1_i1:219-581(-)